MKLPLIFFTLLLFLIVFLRWRAGRPKEEKDEPKETQKPGQEKLKAKSGKWNFSTAGVIATIVLIVIAIVAYNLISSYMYPKAPLVVIAELPVCAGNYNFSNENLPAMVKIGVRTDCWAPVTLPPNINFRTHVDTDMKIVFIDGAEFIDGPDKQVWYGEFRKEMFKVRGIKEAGTLEISMEKKV